MSIGEASTVREIPILLQKTLWHVHLKDWHKNPEKTKQLKTLVAPARKEEPWAKSISEAVQEYMLCIREKANSVQYLALKNLMQDDRQA